MKKTLKEIASLVQGELVGDGSTVITDVRGIKEAQEGDITFVAHARYLSLVEETKASAVIVPLSFKEAGKPVVKAQDPSGAFTQVLVLFHPCQRHHPRGIHETAVIAKTAKIAKNVAIGPHVVVDDEAEIGEGTIIYGGCVVAHGVKVGRDCLLYANVSLREGVVIGHRVSIQSGAVIGSEGFGYAMKDGAHRLIPQVGTVVLEDDVDIGANVTIDRARFDKTRIGKGTKIDNLVHIAHNVVIGENCIILAQVGISGSTTIGDGVTIAGQAGLVGHISVGDGAVLAAQAGVTKSVAPGAIVSGYPARPHQEAKKINAYIQRLPQLSKTVEEIKKRQESQGT